MMKRAGPVKAARAKWGDEGPPRTSLVSFLTDELTPSRVRELKKLPRSVLLAGSDRSEIMAQKAKNDKTLNNRISIGELLWRLGTEIVDAVISDEERSWPQSGG